MFSNNKTRFEEEVLDLSSFDIFMRLLALSAQSRGRVSNFLSTSHNTYSHKGNADDVTFPLIAQPFRISFDVPGNFIYHVKLSELQYTLSDKITACSILKTYLVIYYLSLL